MSHSDRPWEQRSVRDGELNRSTGSALGFAFILVQCLALVAFGFDLKGLLIGFALGVVVIGVLAKVVVRSQQSVRRGPPPDLL
jgi:hypothetical protein